MKHDKAQPHVATVRRQFLDDEGNDAHVCVIIYLQKAVISLN